MSHVRKSTVSTDLEGNPKLQAANVTRWNSEVSMVRSILCIPEENLNELDTKVKLNTHERVLLQELCNILILFETATDCTQGDRIVTVSLVVPSVRGFRAELALINTKCKNKLVTTLRKSIERRLSVYEEQPLFRRAASHNPCFKLAWCIDQSEADAEKQALIAEAHRLRTHVESRNPVSSTDDPPTKRRKLFGFMNQNNSTANTKNSDAADEIETYLSQACLPESADSINFGIQGQEDLACCHSLQESI